MKNVLLNIATRGNQEDGYLSFFESNKEVPFDIKRIYYTYEVPTNLKRGMHAHKELQQVLWCPFGEIKIVLDNGREKKSYLLDSPEKALLVFKGHWHDMYWQKEGSVLCVAASDYYNEEDYIRDYNEFLKYVEERYWNDESQF